MRKFKRLIGVHAIAFNGAQMRVLSDKGEVLGEIDLEPGPVDLSPYDPIMGLGELEYQGLLITKSNDRRLQTIKTDKRHDTAANPEFIPSGERREYFKLAKMVEMVVQKTEERNASKEARRSKARSERNNADNKVGEATKRVSNSDVIEEIAEDKATPNEAEVKVDDTVDIKDAAKNATE